MSVFVCLIRPDGAPIDAATCARYNARREAPGVVPPTWRVDGAFAAMLGSDTPGLVPSVYERGSWIGVGIVRLDSPPSFPAAESDGGDDGSALGVVLAALDRFGDEAIGQLVGDFSFVAWNRTTRAVIAARDTFGVRRLFMTQRGGALIFATRASLIAENEEYDPEFIAEFVLNGYDPSRRSAFLGIETVRPAEMIVHRNGTLRRKAYWAPVVDERPERVLDGNVVEDFRELLFASVQSRLTERPTVWSHLSGGMDSSSIVGVAQTLAQQGTVRHGVAGVITYETTPALGSDLEHATLVAERYQLPHRVLGDWWRWQHDGAGLPLFDQPCGEQSNYVLERRLANAVHEAGGSVLLTGVGADLYLRPQFDILADLVARGRVGLAARELAQWATASRMSFWTLGYRHAVYPLLPARARYALALPNFRVPDWLDEQYVRRYELRERSAAISNYRAPWGAKARLSIVRPLMAHSGFMGQERIGEANLEWRHPFYHRPLVEYGLRLPESWRVAPGGNVSKRVLREAMVGILPDAVRLRRGKGALRPERQLAFRREARRLKQIATRPLLADLGYVAPERFARAVEAAGTGPVDGEGALRNALTLELWLRRRLDAWS